MTVEIIVSYSILFGLFFYLQIFVATALMIFFGTTKCGPDNTLLRLQEFCHILLQSKPDIIQCSEKPSSYNMKGSKAALSYMCCLGYFKDVTNIYKQYLSSDFDQYLASMTSDKQMASIGNFVIMCKNETKTLNTTDFSYWCSNGKTSDVCFAR
ncbi:unnamed protein product [Candidula unifasciata]|uniref:Uncharacterized protein n=1 Tax=Candidula unifasciata TaxID=100452 RepID=A0A8S3ZJP4_9EUPU|nr:unnamed protein product [Candidula unifasciata]